MFPPSKGRDRCPCVWSNRRGSHSPGSLAGGAVLSPRENEHRAAWPLVLVRGVGCPARPPLSEKHFASSPPFAGPELVPCLQLEFPARPLCPLLLSGPGDHVGRYQEPRGCLAPAWQLLNRVSPASLSRHVHGGPGWPACPAWARELCASQHAILHGVVGRGSSGLAALLSTVPARPELPGLGLIIGGPGAIWPWLGRRCLEVSREGGGRSVLRGPSLGRPPLQWHSLTPLSSWGPAPAPISWGGRPPPRVHQRWRAGVGWGFEVCGSAPQPGPRSPGKLERKVGLVKQIVT